MCPVLVLELNWGNHTVNSRPAKLHSDFEADLITSPTKKQTIHSICTYCKVLHAYPNIKYLFAFLFWQYKISVSILIIPEVI